MQQFLPIGLTKSVRPLMDSINKTFRTLLLASGLLVVFSMQSNAQTEPEIIQGWNNLEEADFLFDVYYQLVKCSADSDPQIHLWAFNEGGNVDAVGFDLVLKDEDGTEVNLKVEKFEIGFGQSFKADCSYEDYSFLRFDLPANLDLSSLSIDITYKK